MNIEKYKQYIIELLDEITDLEYIRAIYIFVKTLRE